MYAAGFSNASQDKKFTKHHGLTAPPLMPPVKLTVMPTDKLTFKQWGYGGFAIRWVKESKRQRLKG
jgi:hypothetical protein